MRAFLDVNILIALLDGSHHRSQRRGQVHSSQDAGQDQHPHQRLGQGQWPHRLADRGRPGVVPDFTGRENIYIIATILGMSRQALDKKLNEIIDFSEMSAHLTPCQNVPHEVH